ncbi:uncharacterized protein PGTG_21781 [Puccinia graminis f. sp. tritici CRL 75-36-700-3]|uniref:Tyr recombinase domain-containing protein n=1 Tax=Puccinia graminis f. sp. tritici (strain CRL 75-36-700-3 / race SCCL) TaxID=418459 RepID=H6QSG5_PUCGT|nr:uncharacterized protein PGTG_21781 [Puccinia graminis f. sp. tritici CRL 75-36-700-3]EHS63702.1 hypothetical protein PGTG_21781 [Puccinia graminis f. sp. tritici CRL 75-36-700-3]
MQLFTALYQTSDFDNALIDLCIVAFWGLARLAELTYDRKDGPVRCDMSVLTSDVTFTETSNGMGVTAAITLRAAKTAGPGGTQLILLTEQPHILCPVRAIRRRLAEANGERTSLFGFGRPASRHHITRRAAVTRIQAIFATGGGNQLLGHSFRVGGASLRHALGMKPDQICSLGRWTSHCYRLYLRPYSREDMLHTTSLLRALVSNWSKMS